MDGGRVARPAAQPGGALQPPAAVLNADKEIVATAVALLGGALWSASAELQADKEIVATAVPQNASAQN